jgi:hypothetical protein
MTTTERDQLRALLAPICERLSRLEESKIALELVTAEIMNALIRLRQECEHERKLVQALLTDGREQIETNEDLQGQIHVLKEELRREREINEQRWADLMERK